MQYEECLSHITHIVDDCLKLDAECRITFLSNWWGNSLTTAIQTILAKGQERENVLENTRRHNASAGCDGLTVNRCMEHWNGPIQEKYEDLCVEISIIASLTHTSFLCLKTVPDCPPSLFLQYLRLSELTAFCQQPINWEEVPIRQHQTMPRN